MPAARRWNDADGFTLPELLIATVLALLVLGAGVTAFSTAIRSQPRVLTQADAIQHARTAMEGMVRELRQGSTVPSATSSQLSVITYVRDASCGTTTPQCRVTYSCTGSSCTRTVARPDGSSPGPAVQVISGLLGSAIFNYTAPTSTTPASIGITLSLPAQGGSNAITLSDRATLRNSTVP